MTPSFQTGFLTLFAALALGACTATDPTAKLSLEESVAAPRLVALANPKETPSAPLIAVALPPEAGAVTDAASHTAPGGVLQEVALDGGAAKGVRNGVTLAVPADVRGKGPALFGKPYEPAIRAELKAYFPGVAMQVMTRASANAYGPYGLALGRAQGDVRCLYAWQWIDEAQTLARVAIAGPIGTRVRLCRANQSFDDLAATVDRLMLGRDAPAAPVVTSLEPVAPAATAKPHRRVTHARLHRRHHHPTAPALAQSAPAAPQGFVPVAVAAEATKLSTDLPAEAYRGPIASSLNTARP